MKSQSMSMIKSFRTNLTKMFFFLSQMLLAKVLIKSFASLKSFVTLRALHKIADLPILIQGLLILV